MGPILHTIGAVLWLVGAALIAGAQERLLVPTGAVVSGGTFVAGCVLLIIASAVWILASLVALASAYAQAAVVSVAGRRPGLAVLSLGAAWTAAIAPVLLLVGSAIMCGTGLDNASGGAIVILAGFILWMGAFLFVFAVNFVVSTVLTWLPAPAPRQYVWGATTSTLVVIIGFILYVVGSVAWVVRDPPGLFLTGSIVHVVASVYALFGFWLLARETVAFYTPLWGFAASAPMMSGAAAGGAVAGSAAGTAVGVGGTGKEPAAAPTAGTGVGAAPALTVRQPVPASAAL
jgi:hypothetical protein